jgi:hypothetical protein
MKNRIKEIVILLILIALVSNNLLSSNSVSISNLSKYSENGAVNFKFQNLNISSNNYDELSTSSAYENFINKNGEWYFSINKFSGLPTRAFGKPIKIKGFEEINSDNVYKASIEFISKNLNDFGINPIDLKLVRAEKVDSKWYVTLNQFLNDIEVVNTEVELRISDDAKVFSFGSKYFNYLDQRIQNNNVVKGFNPIESATTGLDFINSNEIIFVNQFDEKILPIPTENGYVFKRVIEVPFSANDNNYIFVSYVDKSNGELIYRHNIHNDVNTYVQNKGTVKFKHPSEKDTLVYFNDMNLSFGTNTVLTNNLGKATIDLAAPTSFTAKFIGPWVKVTRKDSKTANYSKTLNPGDNHVITWTDSMSMNGERTLFYHANYIHAYYKKLDPSFVGMDIVLDLQIDFTGSANANSSGPKITFVGCQDPNFKLYESASVLYHEWGHSVNYFLYKSKGSTSGMINGSCNEACADITACMMLDDNWVGRGVKPKEPNFKIRDLKNKFIYPDSVAGESHHDGMILSGAFWDLREMTSADFVMKLSHKAKYGIPDDFNVGISFSEWFLETLIADDDDNDLTNGTPYFDKIVECFNNHRIGTDLYTTLSFKHTQLPDTKDTLNNYQVNFDINYIPLPNAKPSPIKMIYQVNNEKTLNEVIATELEKGKYTASIPAKHYGTVIKYYFTAYEKYSAKNLILSKSQSKLVPYTFLVGFNEVLRDDFETNDNWTIGIPSDKATTGKWELAKPNLINVNGLGVIQPDKGTGNLGLKCFVTGALGTSSQYYNYMPNGTTTITSKTFNLIEYNNPVVRFNKWFYNYWYYNIIPSFGFYISSDNGTTWKTVEFSSKPTLQWEGQVFSLADYISKFDSVKFRFSVDVIKSQFTAWVTEALVDEFQILSPAKFISDVSDNKNGKRILEIYPNPASGSVNINYQQLYAGNGTGDVDICLYSTGINEEIIGITAYDISGNKLAEINKFNQNDPQLILNTKYKGLIILHINTINEGIIVKSFINN